ncbi:MAG: hypothetical protein NC293_12510 [Roseburia sp.]|nr:hypothetical protein [Roseburia sp.]
MIIKDYISEGGVHIKVNDDALDDSPENRERIYKNLSRIATNILIRKYREERKESQ